jgi:hypothetical protein
MLLVVVEVELVLVVVELVLVVVVVLWVGRHRRPRCGCGLWGCGGFQPYPFKRRASQQRRSSRGARDAGVRFQFTSSLFRIFG